MAFRRNSNRGSFPRKARRNLEWIGTAEASVTWQTVAAGAKLLGLIFPITSPGTILRTRGLLQIRSDQIVATENIMGAFGMAVVSTDAADAGAASIPGPMSDPGWSGWFVFEMFSDVLKFQSGIGFQSNYPQTRMLDGKAMRKVNANDTIVVVYESGANSLGVNVLANIRMLIQTP